MNTKKTDNRRFYDVMREWGKDFWSVKTGSRENLPFCWIFHKMGMPPDSYLADYDESVDYRCVVLSQYYYKIWWDNELDFRGNPQGNLCYAHKMADVMKKHQIPEEYIYPRSFFYSGDYADYKALVEEYNLILPA